MVEERISDLAVKVEDLTAHVARHDAALTDMVLQLNVWANMDYELKTAIKNSLSNYYGKPYFSKE